MAKATGARDGHGRCLHLLASHQQPCGLSRDYGEDQVLETGIRDRNGQCDGKRLQGLPSVEINQPTGAWPSVQMNDVNSLR